MNCMKCGAVLTESAYCPKCGCDVVVQKQAIVLSGLYYNQALEKAQIRDLSGAIDQLKRSLKFNKLNIPARNLLGLVYFETGEVVAALSEWVISKNIMPQDNMAVEYINKLQADPNKLEMINQTIKKYNQALQCCRQGNEDVAVIQLKKVLAQNPKLIKGYHLLALLHIHYEEYERARRILKKAAKIDKTNTTTLRFLREIDEQTGTVTTLEPRFRSHVWEKKDKTEQYAYQTEVNTVIQPPTFRESSVVATLLNIGFGLVIGIAAVWFLFMPARIQRINQNANEKVTQYSQTMASQSAELDQAQAKITESEETVTTANQQIEDANTQAASYENLVKAFNAVQENDYTVASNAIAVVDRDLLSVDSQEVYDTVLDTVQTIMFDKLYTDGIEAYDNKKYSVAITALTQAKTIKPDDYQTLNYLAQSYRLNGDVNQAIQAFQEIVDKFPGTKKATDSQNYIESLGGSNSLSANASQQETLTANISANSLTSEENSDSSDEQTRETQETEENSDSEEEE